MRVNWQTRQTKHNTAQNIGRLATYAGQSHQIFNPARHFTAKSRHHLTRHANQIFRFRLIETRRTHQLLNMRHVGDGKSFGRRVRIKKRRRHHIYANVCALRRENRRSQQLKRRLMGQLANRHRIFTFQQTQYIGRTLCNFNFLRTHQDATLHSTASRPR